jgi:hypothetical protein
VNPYVGSGHRVSASLWQPGYQGGRSRSALNWSDEPKARWACSKGAACVSLRARSRASILCPIHAFESSWPWRINRHLTPLDPDAHAIRPLAACVDLRGAEGLRRIRISIHFPSQRRNTPRGEAN